MCIGSSRSLPDVGTEGASKENPEGWENNLPPFGRRLLNVVLEDTFGDPLKFYACPHNGGEGDESDEH